MLNVSSGYNSSTILCYHTNYCWYDNILSANKFIALWHYLTISFLTLSRFQRNNQLLSPPPPPPKKKEKRKIEVNKLNIEANIETIPFKQRNISIEAVPKI